MLVGLTDLPNLAAPQPSVVGDAHLIALHGHEMLARHKNHSGDRVLITRLNAHSGSCGVRRLANPQGNTA
jgi:hypothetical protein